jgi:uncharacterized DUF497 family protein
VKITYDPVKRAKTLMERGLEFARQDYDEPRFITVGKLDGGMVVVVWTQRGDETRVISMRKANEREQAKYGHRVD